MNDGRIGYTMAVITIAQTRADVIQRIQAAEEEILALGVHSLALFGSVGRDAAQPGSDVDILV